MKNWVRIFVAAVAVATLLVAVAGKAFAEEKAAPTASAAPAPAATTEAAKPAEKTEVTLTIKDHKFDPELLDVPSNKKITITIKNEDNGVEEFDSMSLHREKLIPAKGSAVITVGPLTEGEYEFVGEFHKDTAKGKLVVK